MTDAYVCDKCDTTVNREFGDPVRAGEVDPFTFQRGGDESRYGDIADEDSPERHLCPECAKAFEEWLTGTRELSGPLPPEKRV